jgi:hypothetical protein
MIKWAKAMMMKKTIILCFLLGIMASCSGCQKLRKIFVKPPPEGVVQESYTVRLSGYEQTVTVKASPEAVSKYISDLENLVLPGYETREMREFLAEGEVLGVGRSFPASINQMGLSVSGHMIVIKRDGESMWWVFDNPQFFTVQRWSFKPVRGGTSLTFKVVYEIPENLQQLVELTGIIDELMKDIDMLLARIQAHFDPSLDPEKLVAVGLRGESYETLWQVHESSIWVNASPRNVVRTMIEPDNMIGMLSILQVEGLGECLHEPEHRRKWEGEEDGEPVFCPSTLKLAGFKWKVDTFTVINPDDPQDKLTAYGLVVGLVFRIKVMVQPEKGGTRARIIFAFEPPGPSTSNLIDTIIAISGVPEWIAKALQDIKARVEGVG